MMSCLSLRRQTYRDMKDRQLLAGYRGKVERGSPEERKINELLNNTVRRTRRTSRSASCDLTCASFFSFSKSAGKTDRCFRDLK